MSAKSRGELIPIGGGDNIPLVRDRLTIGRRDSCDICLRFQNISGVHCELTYQDGYWLIRDKDSTNGIKVNNVRVQQKPLRPGDEIAIANHRYTIEYEMAAGRHAFEELLEDDVMSQPLLEKAGLIRPRRQETNRPRPNTPFDPARFLSSED